MNRGGEEGGVDQSIFLWTPFGCPSEDAWISSGASDTTFILIEDIREYDSSSSSSEMARRRPVLRTVLGGTNVLDVICCWVSTTRLNFN